MHVAVSSALAVGMFALGAPAYADHLVGGCGLAAISSEAASAPDEFTGVIYGALAGAGDRRGRCWLRVDGEDLLLDTELGLVGSGVASNSRDVTYVAGEISQVLLCEEVGGHPTACREADRQRFPMPIVAEVLDLVAGLDPIRCPLFGQLPDAPPLVEFDSTGDLFVAGQLLWDCPPYDGGARPVEMDVHYATPRRLTT